MAKRAVLRPVLAALLLCALFLPTSASVHAVSPGEVDTSFDAGVVNWFFGNGTVYKIVPLPGGKMLVGGAIGTIGGGNRNGIARLNADGSLDPTFTSPFVVGPTVPVVNNIVIQPDGKILVSGSGLNITPAGPYRCIARLNPDGTLDPSFILQDMAVSRGVLGLALLPDGRILIGGDFSNIGPAFVKSIVRLLPDGTLDPTFSLWATTDAHGGTVETIVVQPDGNYLVGGDFTFTIGAQDYSRLARLRPDATIDTSFQLTFNTFEGPFIRSIALRPDGDMFVAGAFSSIDGTPIVSAARITSAGALDTSFDVFHGVGALVNAILLQPSGKLLVTGNFFIPGARSLIARVDETGAYDSFYPPGGIVGVAGQTLAVQADGKVLAGGQFFQIGGISRNQIARMHDVLGNTAPNAVDDAAVTAEDTAVTVNVTANDTDADGDPLTVASVTPPAHGTATIVGTTSVTYTPAANYNGPDAFTYTVDDGHGGTDTANVTVTVTPVNDPPFANFQAVVTSEDVALGIVLTGTDPDGNPLTYSIVSPPSHGTVSGVPPNLLYTPQTNFNGSDGFSFRVHDGTVFSPPAGIAITVDPVNDPPLAANDAYATPAATPLVVPAPGVLANDTDVEGGPLIASLLTPPANGTLVLSANGGFTYTPAAGFSGTDTFQYRANDGGLPSNVAVVSIAVAPAMMKISATGDPLPGGTGTFTTFPGAPSVGGSLVVFRALGTSGQQGLFSCMPGDPCIPIANLSTLIPGGTGTFTGFGTPANAGRFTSFVGNGAGQAGAYSCDRATPTDPCVPLANLGTPIPGGTGSFTGFISPDAAGRLTSFIGTGSGQAGVYACDRAIPTDPCLPIASRTTPIPGGTGTFDSFLEQTLVADVSLPTQPPVVGFIATGASQLGVYSCDRAAPTDPCRPVATLSTAIPSGTGSFTGFDHLAIGREIAQPTPPPIVAFIGRGTGQQGVYACMPGDPCAPIATLTTSIPGGAGAFTGFSAVSTSRGHTAFLATGASGQSGIYVASTLQKVVAVGDVVNGRTVASLRFGRDGLDGNRLAFAAAFTDGTEGVFVASIALVGNAAPFAIDDAATTNEDAAVTIDVLANDSDADGDAIVLTGVTAPAHGVAAIAAGRITYTPATDYNGPDSFSYSISDGRGGADSAQVDVTVAAVNDPPVAAGDAYTTPQGTTLSVPAPGVLANDTDPDGNPLTAAVVGGVAHGTVTLAANGSFSYVPAAGYSGPDAFTYRASDGTATSNVATVNLTVTPATTGGWQKAASLSTPRTSHTATRLADGRVLVVGGAGPPGAERSAEIFDPATGQWTATAALNRPRVEHTATLLPNGKVLVAGTSSFAFGISAASSAEVFDPATGAWTLTGTMSNAHGLHTATLLPNGKVLVVGGAFIDPTGGKLFNASAPEVYDPAAGTWAAAGTLANGRLGHDATLLANGRVLVSGGVTVGLLPSLLRRCDVYDPATNAWTRTGDLNLARITHTTTLLADGRVVAAGGVSGLGTTSSERFDPATGVWTATGSTAARSLHEAVRLANGRVLAAGGVSGVEVPTRTAALFDPASATWSATGSLLVPRAFHTLTILTDGRVLAVGGISSSGALASVEIYLP